MHFFYFGVHPLSLGSAKNSPFWTQKIDSKRFRMIKQLFLDKDFFLNDGFPKLFSRCQLYRELDGFSFSSTIFSMRDPPWYLAPSMPWEPMWCTNAKNLDERTFIQRLDVYFWFVELGFLIIFCLQVTIRSTFYPYHIYCNFFVFLDYE